MSTSTILHDPGHNTTHAVPGREALHLHQVVPQPNDVFGLGDGISGFSEPRGSFGNGAAMFSQGTMLQNVERVMASVSLRATDVSQHVSLAMGGLIETDVPRLRMKRVKAPAYVGIIVPQGGQIPVPRVEVEETTQTMRTIGASYKISTWELEMWMYDRANDVVKVKINAFKAGLMAKFESRLRFDIEHGIKTYLNAYAQAMYPGGFVNNSQIRRVMMDTEYVNVRCRTPLESLAQRARWLASRLHPSHTHGYVAIVPQVLFEKTALLAGCAPVSQEFDVRAHYYRNPMNDLLKADAGFGHHKFVTPGGHFLSTLSTTFYPYKEQDLHDEMGGAPAFVGLDVIGQCFDMSTRAGASYNHHRERDITIATTDLDNTGTITLIDAIKHCGVFKPDPPSVADINLGQPLDSVERRKTVLTTVAAQYLDSAVSGKCCHNGNFKLYSDSASIDSVVTYVNTNIDNLLTRMGKANSDAYTRLQAVSIILGCVVPETIAVEGAKLVLKVLAGAKNVAAPPNRDNGQPYVLDVTPGNNQTITKYFQWIVLAMWAACPLTTQRMEQHIRNNFLPPLDFTAYRQLQYKTYATIWAMASAENKHIADLGKATYMRPECTTTPDPTSKSWKVDAVVQVAFQVTKPDTAFNFLRSVCYLNRDASVTPMMIDNFSSQIVELQGNLLFQLRGVCGIFPALDEIEYKPLPEDFATGQNATLDQILSRVFLQQVNARIGDVYSATSQQRARGSLITTLFRRGWQCGWRFDGNNIVQDNIVSDLNLCDGGMPEQFANTFL